MYIYIHIYIYVYIYIYMYTYIYIYTYTYIHTDTYIYIYNYIYTYKYKWKWTFVNSIGPAGNPKPASMIMSASTRTDQMQIFPWMEAGWGLPFVNFPTKLWELGEIWNSLFSQEKNKTIILNEWIGALHRFIDLLKSDFDCKSYWSLFLVSQCFTSQKSVAHAKLLLFVRRTTSPLNSSPFFLKIQQVMGNKKNKFMYKMVLGWLIWAFHETLCWMKWWETADDPTFLGFNKINKEEPKMTWVNLHWMDGQHRPFPPITNHGLWD